MKMITKTPRKIILKIDLSRIENEGFDQVWDDVRDNYPLFHYDIHDIIVDEDGEKNDLFIEFNRLSEEEHNIYG